VAAVTLRRLVRVFSRAELERVAKKRSLLALRSVQRRA